MITEVVIFPIPANMTREQVVALYERSTPAWRANPDLVHNSFLYESQNKRGCGVYLWKRLEAAKHGHDSKWCARIAEVFEGEPKFDYFETPVVIDYAIQIAHCEQSSIYEYTLQQATERINVMSNNTLDLDQTEAKVLLTNEVSDEALEAAAAMDQRLRGMTFAPIWCPDSASCK